VSIRTRILLGIGPILLVLPLAIAFFQYRVHMTESAWAESEEVTALSRALAEMARTDDVTMSTFAAMGDRADVPPRIRVVLERRAPARIAGLRVSDRTVAFDSALSRTMPPLPEVAELFEADAVAVSEGDDTWRAWAPVRDREGRPHGIMVAEIWSSKAEVAREALVRGGLIVLISGLIGVVVCRWLGSFVTRHITRLSVQSQGLDESNLLATRQISRLQARSLPAPSPIQEVDDLGMAFDTMSSVLVEMVQKVRLSMNARNPVAEEGSLMQTFQANRPVPAHVGGGRIEAFGRAVGVAAGHVLYLRATDGGLWAVAYRIPGAKGVDGQVAAAAALECLDGAISRGFGPALEILASLFPGGAGLAVERQAESRQWRFVEGRWQQEIAATGTCVVHTFEGETARAMDLYVSVYGSAKGEVLADELAGLVRGRDEGVLAVVGALGGDTPDVDTTPGEEPQERDG
jgi:hypothetical protein